MVFIVLDHNGNIVLLLFIELKKASWKCLVNYYHSSLYQSFITKFCPQVYMAKLPGHTVRRECTSGVKTVGNSVGKSWPDVHEGTSTPVLLWQPGGFLSLPLTAS